MDHLQDYNDERNQDALDKVRLESFKDIEFVSGDWECSDCGVPITIMSKARHEAPEPLCGQCADWHRKHSRLGKMREGYQ
jgi:hypothetical protein